MSNPMSKNDDAQKAARALETAAREHDARGSDRVIWLDSDVWVDDLNELARFIAFHAAVLASSTSEPSTRQIVYPCDCPVERPDAPIRARGTAPRCVLPERHRGDHRAADGSTCDSYPGGALAWWCDWARAWRLIGSDLAKGQLEKPDEQSNE